MFRIRAIKDLSLPANRLEIEEAQALLRDRLPGVPRLEVEDIPSRLADPTAHGFHTALYVADDLRGHLKGFALVSHAPAEKFCLLDFIATTHATTATGGVGGALYERAREHARASDSLGLFYECLPDDPDACSNPEHAKANGARLRFYERFGARPIAGTGYETPMTPGGKDLPHLVFDDLGSARPLRAAELRKVIRAILERKYPHLCSPEYVKQVLATITADPVALREPRYTRPDRPRPPAPPPPTGERLVALVVNDRHDIHHVRERGYVEAPARVKSILDGILPTGLFWPTEPREYPESHIRAVHDAGFVDYLKRVCAKVPQGKSIYPYVFPIRNNTRPPTDLTYAAGYYCIDTFTPLNQNAWKAAKRAVDCTLTAADAVLTGQQRAYALVRPPGHHAEHRAFGGFCYFCNAAVAAHYLSRHARVAILDIDYHHGNGQQEIFYRRGDVLTVSIHAHPSVAYPFFSGFEDETGEGDGAGANLNIALPEHVDAPQYRTALRAALRRVAEYKPAFLIVCLGLDTAKGDPTGTWSLAPKDFEANGKLIADLDLPTLVVQEGGYRTAALGACARSFFQGLCQDAGAAPGPRPPRGPAKPRTP